MSIFNKVECPYCWYENDMSDALTDLGNDNAFDHPCENCEREFEVHVDFDPSFRSSEIVYEKCDRCDTETRDLCKKGKIYPFPKHFDAETLCKACWKDGIREIYESEEKTDANEISNDI